MLKTIKFVICWLLVLLIRHSVKAELYPVQLWENLVGDATNSYNSGRILTLEENNVIALAYKSGYTYLIRYNANGDTLWTKSLHFNGTSIQQASDQGFIIVGSHGTIYDNLLICRTDANGDTLWTKIYNSPDIGPDATFDHSIANDVQIEDNGDLIIIGERYYQFQRPTSSSVTLPSMWLLKTDPDGDTIWTKLFFNGTTYSKAINIYPAPGGGFSVIGSKCYYDVTTGNGPSFVWYLQLNSEGDTILSKEYSIHSETSYIASISGTPTFDAGNAIGYYTNFDSSLFVLRMNADGDTVWSKKIAFNPDIPNAITVRQTPDSGLVICYGYRKNNYLSPFVIRMNRNGDILWSNIFDDCFSTSSKGKSDIVPLSDHCFILSGTSTWTFGEVARPAVWLCKIEESAPPVVLESVANDNVVENSGIDIDDYILITFGNHRCLKNARFRKYYLNFARS